MNTDRTPSVRAGYEFAKFADVMGEHPSIFRQLMDTIPCGLMLIDPRGRVFHWSSEAARLTGIAESRAIGRRCGEIFNCPEWTGLYEVFDPENHCLQSHCGEVVLENRGRTVHLQKRANPIHNSQGRLVCIMISLKDLTGRDESEKALQEARDLVESARKAKRHFMANMNHEIRTPLNGIIGLLELMLSENPKPTQMEYISNAKRSANLLLDLVDDILDFTIVDKGDVHIELTGFSLASIISSVIARQYGLTQNKQVCIHSHIEEDVPDNLLGDSGRLYQILKQLVGNAIKFTPAGEIAVRVARIPDTPNASEDASRRIVLHFSISDTGVGIPQKKLDAIFQSLSQVDESLTRAFGGLGIGLNMVHKLVLLLEGRIWMESEAGRGTTVHFVLPFKSISSGDAAAAAHASATGASSTGSTGLNTYAGPEDRRLSLAATPLPPQWISRFDALAETLARDSQSAEALIAELKTEAQAYNQNSIATLLFRMLLALRRADRDNVDHYHAWIAQKLHSNPGDCPPNQEGGTHESISRRR